jgi:hypothetical protein
MKNFGQISFKQTAKKVVVEDVLLNPRVWSAAHDAFDGDQATVTDGRQAVIDADLRAIRCGARGLTAPVQTVILPAY